MTEKSNESQLLRGAFLPTLIVGLVAIAISAFIQGLSGFWGALLAQFVVVIFFVIHIAVSRMTRNLDPISTMAMALFSYFAKVFEREQAAMDALENGSIVAGDVVVIRYEGPKGGPGMREMLMITGAIKGAGLGKSVL